jgi:hypothetical protein
MTRIYTVQPTQAQENLQIYLDALRQPWQVWGNQGYFTKEFVK